LFINKLNSDTPIDAMEDEERELTLLQSKKVEKGTPEIGNTGNSTMKNSIGARSNKNNKPLYNKQGSHSNTEKEYDWLISNLKNQVNNKEEILKSDKYLEAQNSFSFENNELFNKTVQDKNISLNKSNFLTYDKKVKAVQNLNATTNVAYLENTKLLIRKDSDKDNSLSYQQPLQEVESKDMVWPSAHSKVSQESFQKMSNYVKNTFRKNKVTKRKNSYYSFSSHRRKESFGNNMMQRGKRWDGIKSERPFSVKSNNSSSHREVAMGVLSWDSASIASMIPQDKNYDTLLNKNKELKVELHKSRKNNGILRSKVMKKDKEVNILIKNNLELENKVKRLEEQKYKQKDFINTQEKEIQNLQKHWSGGSPPDPEKDELKAQLEQIIEVKLKYEKILKALVDMPEVKPIIAKILEQ